jgi:uncharacterized protein DUF6799
MKATLSVILSAIFAVAMMSGCATEGRQTAKTECIVKDGKLLDRSGKPMTGCVMMRNGKMMMMDGKLVPMRRNMTMPDGTVCMVNGVCVMKGGAKRNLGEGEVVTAQGNIFHAKGLTAPGEYY